MILVSKLVFLILLFNFYLYSKWLTLTDKNIPIISDELQRKRLLFPFFVMRHLLSMKWQVTAALFAVRIHCKLH